MIKKKMRPLTEFFICCIEKLRVSPRKNKPHTVYIDIYVYDIIIHAQTFGTWCADVST